jgi:hypothetical protein
MEWSSRLLQIFLSRRVVADRKGTADVEIAGMPISLELSWIQMLHRMSVWSVAIQGLTPFRIGIVAETGGPRPYQLEKTADTAERGRPRAELLELHGPCRHSRLTHKCNHINVSTKEPW